MMVLFLMLELGCQPVALRKPIGAFLADSESAGAVSVAWLAISGSDYTTLAAEVRPFADAKLARPAALQRLRPDRVVGF